MRPICLFSNVVTIYLIYLVTFSFNPLPFFETAFLCLTALAVLELTL